MSADKRAGAAVDWPASRGVLTLLTVVAVLGDGVHGRRYRYCGQGCCLHEYCAYHTICYPKIHCSLGCPDGTCEQGACMPLPPCNDSSECSLGHACDFHFNLGYHTCQYNLDVSNTLCVDTEGRSILKPLA